MRAARRKSTPVREIAPALRLVPLEAVHLRFIYIYVYT
jgi:hypothetical protein